MNRIRDHMWSCDCNKTYCVFIIVHFYYCIIYKTILIVVYYFVKINQNVYLSVSKNKNRNEKLDPMRTIVTVYNDGRYFFRFITIIYAIKLNKR